MLANVTGWTEDAILAMPTHRVRRYLDFVPWLRARGLNDAITAAVFPHTTDQKRADIMSDIDDALDLRDDEAKHAEGLRALKRRFGRGNAR